MERWRCSAVLALVLAVPEPAAAQVPPARGGRDRQPPPVVLDATLQRRVPAGLVRSGEEADGFVVEGPDGRADLFARGVAILRVAPGLPIEEHLKEAGLRRAGPGPHGLGALQGPPGSASPGLKAEWARRVAWLEDPARPRWLAVRLPMDRPAPAWSGLASLGALAALKGSRVSDDAGLRTLAWVAAHRLRYRDTGYELALDPIAAPQGFMTATSEGSAVSNPLSSLPWRLTGLDQAFRLAQVSRVRKAPGYWGPSVVLGVVDRGFATSVTELAPIWSVGFIGGPDRDPSNGSTYHGTKVTSVAAAPVNDGLGGAGTAFKSQGSSIPDALDPAGSVAFLWVRPASWRFSDWAQGITQAVLAIVDVVNFSMGGYCNGWCRSFSLFSGLDELRSALEFAKRFDTPVVASAGNDGDDLDADGRFYVPCELAGDLTVCIGNVDGFGARHRTSNHGSHVAAFAPGVSLTVGPVPDAPSIGSFNGTSASAPFVSGVVASAILLKGSALTGAEVRSGLVSTGTPSADPTVGTVLEAHRFLRQYADILPDRLEPNDYEWQAALGLPADQLLTTHQKPNGIPDQDWFHVAAGNVPRCGSVELDVTYLPLDGWEPEVRTDATLTWRRGAGSAAGLRHFVISPIQRPWLSLGLRGSDPRPNGYSLGGVVFKDNPYPLGEGPTYPASCNGVDDDCDGLVDEGFPDTDGDGKADCADDDDDDDCVPDATDNCPLVVNATQFCPQATGPGAAAPTAASGCGNRSCHLVNDPRVVVGLDRAVIGCFAATPIDPACFDDGCPFPGPLIFPEIQEALLAAREVIGVVRPGHGPPDPRWAAEARTLLGMQQLGGGLVRLPAWLRAGPREATEGGTTARGLKVGQIVACRPLLKLGAGIVEQLRKGSARAACWDAVRALPCQADRDGDGRGDACDP